MQRNKYKKIMVTKSNKSVPMVSAAPGILPTIPVILAPLTPCPATSPRKKYPSYQEKRITKAHIKKINYNRRMK